MAAEEGQVIACHTVEAWNEQLQKGNDSNTLVISFLPSSNFLSIFDLVLLIYVCVVSYPIDLIGLFGLINII